jgi:hypothetical protein
MDEGREAVRQAVEIALNVGRFRWQIYNTNFGAELNDLVGDDEAYIEAELPRMVEDALSPDNRVVSVDNYAFSRRGDALSVSFSVHTVFGDLEEEVEL